MLTGKPWRPEAVILFCGLQAFSFCLGGLLVGLLGKTGWAVFQVPNGMGVVLLATLSFQGASWALIRLFLRFHDLDWREMFGLRDPYLARALLRAILTVAALLPVLWLMQGLAVRALTALGWPPDDQTAVKMFEGITSVWGQCYMALFAVVLAPVAEEFIFRGMLFPFIKELGYPRVAWVGVSALFALIHLNAAIFLPLFVLALALTWLYASTGNLLASITAHATFNAINLALLVAEPWLRALFHWPAE